MKEYRIWKVFSKELNREKRVYVYLPRSYHKTEKHYPVLYMHDGHNLFDEKTSYAKASWGIIEA